MTEKKFHWGDHVERLRAVMDSNLPQTQKLVLHCLVDHAWEDGTGAHDGRYPGMTTIMLQASCDRNAVRRALEELLAAGLITDTDKKDYHGSAVYDVNIDAVRALPSYIKPRKRRCPRDTKEELVEAFDRQCPWCQGEGTLWDGPDRHPWVVKMVNPWGKYEPDNMGLICADCHRRRVYIVDGQSGTYLMSDRLIKKAQHDAQ